MMRTDEAELILGQRLNVWTSILVFLLGRLDLLVHGPPGPAASDPARQSEPESQRCGIARLR